jgi:hypothetical protein
MSDSDSETIIIPENGQPASGASLGEAFQVKTIYPLPASASSEMQVLGWTSGESAVGYFIANHVSADALPNGLQLLAPPYEQPKRLVNTSILSKSILGLSPDGKQIAALDVSANSISLTLMTVEDGQIKHFAVPAVKKRTLLSRIIQWSNNSRYISFLAAGDSREQLNIVIHDVVDGTSQTLPLRGYSNTEGGLSAILSNDGSHVLMNDGKLVAMAKRNADGGFEVQYDHPAVTGGSTWVDDDRFIFLGKDGTLFQYDHRNGELSVLMEKVSSFSLSPDRKVIAYTRNDMDAIYVGQRQGNNVLYETAVYQGIVPYEMMWSLSNRALLIDGSKPYSRTAQELAPAPAADQEGLRAFIITFQ